MSDIHNPKGVLIPGPWERPKRGPTDGDGTGEPPAMTDRITRLEVHVEHVQADVTEIKTDLKSVLGKITDLPTRANLHNYTLTGIALGLAVMAIVIGGIIGGITYIVTKQGAPQVTVVTVPPQPAPAAK